jgi:hypothetical protein
MKSKLLYNLIAVILFAGAGYATVDMWQPPRHDDTFIGVGTSEDPLGVNFDTVASKEYVDDAVGEGGGSPYLVYTAMISQAGTGAPVVTVLENTLGVTATWSYVDVGIFKATLSDDLNPAQTYFPHSGLHSTNPGDVNYVAIANFAQPDEINLYSFALTGGELGDLSNEVLGNAFFQIVVIP